jgi:hypothetical protein
VLDTPSSSRDEVRTAEVISSLCLATDYGMGLPFEHSLQSTLIAMRLAERLEVDGKTRAQVYYGCLLFYVGCTVDAEVAADLFDEDALLTHFTPVMFGSPRQTMAGIIRALAGPGSAPPARIALAATRLPRAVRGHQRHIVALCEVAQMLSERLGMPPHVHGLFAHLIERWDGRADPPGSRVTRSRSRCASSTSLGTQLCNGCSAETSTRRGSSATERAAPSTPRSPRCSRTTSPTS